MRSSRRLPLTAGLKQGAGELDPAGRGGLELTRVDESEVRQRRREVEARLAQRLEQNRAGGSQLLMLAGAKAKPLEPERLALEPAGQLALLVGHLDRRKLQRATSQARRSRVAGRADRAADPRVGLEPPVHAAGRVGRQQRLEQGQVEAVGPHRERDGVGLVALDLRRGRGVAWGEAQPVRQEALDGECAAARSAWPRR